MHNVTRRPFAKLSTTVAAIALGLIVTNAGPAVSAAESGNEARQAQDDKLQSEFLVFATKMIPLLRAGFNWNSPISLIGIRAALEPSPAENRMDVYDDIILRVIDESITQWVTSTDPSKGVSHDANQRPKVRSSTL